MNKLLWKLLTGAGLNMYATDDTGGGGGAEGGEAVGSGNDARVAMLNSIGDNADRERGEEFQEFDDAGNVTDFTAPPPVVAEEDAEAIAAAAEAQAEADRAAAEQAALTSEAPPQKIMRKVNGEEIEITDDLLVKAQKIASADTYLAEAKRLRQNLATQKPSEQDVSSTAVETDLASIVRAIQMGTEEEAIEAVRKLVPKGPSSDDLARKIDERLTFNDAYTKFQNDYADIMADPILRSLAEQRDAALVKQGDARPYYERFKDSGDYVRSWRETVASPKQVDAAPAVTKLERKAAAPAVPKAAMGKSAQAVQEEKEESASDVIAAMARQRGGPQWMNGAGNQ
jgi:hypothetical protein